MKILILSCNTGEGHNSAAHAVYEELCRRGAECELIDALSIAGGKTSHLISASYSAIITHVPRVFGAIYSVGEAYNRTGLTSPVYYANAAYAKRLGKYISDGGYGAVICTHLFPMEALTFLRARGECFARCCGVLTDYTCVPFWNETDMDAWCLPHGEIKAECERAGMPPERLFVTGLPVSPRFEKRMTRAAARDCLDIPQELKMFLVMTGGVGSGSALGVCESLLAEAPENSAVYVMAGHNSAVKEKLEEKYGGDSRVRALAFTRQVNVYMNAADALITKPGGITSTEAAVSGVPLVHANAIPGCETRNAELFSRLGLSLCAEDDAQAAHYACLLAKNRGLAEKMTEAQRENIIPDGARRVAELVLSL